MMMSEYHKIDGKIYVDLEHHEDCIKESESMTKSIISACESVGRDADGKFPFNAYDLAQRIIKLEAKLKELDAENAELKKQVEGLEKKLDLEKHKKKSWKVEHDSTYERLVENEKSTSKKYKSLLDMCEELDEESE